MRGEHLTNQAETDIYHTEKVGTDKYQDKSKPLFQSLKIHDIYDLNMYHPIALLMY